MNSWIYSFNVSISSAALLLSVMGLWFTSVISGIDRWSRRFFKWFFAMLVLCVIASFAEMATYGDPSLILMEKELSYLASLFPSIMIAMPTVYLLHCCEEDFRKSALLRAVVAAWVVYFAMLGIAQFTTVFYYYTPDGDLQFGPWYPLSVAPLAAILVLNLIGVIHRRGKLSKKRLYSFLAFLIPLSVALLTHMITSAYELIAIGIAISALSMFAIVVLEHIEQYLHLQRETARQRASIAVLQMRPHFIHNPMTSIYYLCEQDPKVAQQVTMDFNTYLRKNFTAIAKDEAIPFVEELEHTRAYLAVEQAQFANKLVVDFDTPHTQFRVPPLTLQPLAENAVKHGMNPETVPLRVRIRTRKTDSGSEIVVEDNGSGFDPAVANKPDTTLANIRQRLEMMCDGTLEITSGEQIGTVVKVTIP